jgi:hypothetical protein
VGTKKIPIEKSGMTTKIIEQRVSASSFEGERGLFLLEKATTEIKGGVKHTIHKKRSKRNNNIVGKGCVKPSQELIR